MRHQRKIVCLSVFVGLMVVAGHVVNLGFDSAQAGEEEGSVAEARMVVAQVNGKPIYEEQLKPEVEKGLRTFRRYGMHKDDPELVKRLQQKALDKLIGEELFSQESRKLTIDDVDERVEQKLKALERKHGAGERMEYYLKQRRLTMEDLRESFRARVYVDEYLDKQGISDPEIPEDRIREAYDGNPDGYSRVEAVEVSHVLIAVDENAEAEEKEQARKEAERIRKLILEGKDFAEMAKNHSDCNSASGGGGLGYIKRGYMPEGFDTVAFAVEKDAVSEVVETKFGYHIVKVLDKKAAGVLPYEEVREFIKEFLQQDESKKMLAAHMAELKAKANIEILLPE